MTKVSVENWCQAFGEVSVTAPASLRGARRALGAAAHRGAHGFGRNQVQVLVVGDLVQTVAVLKQLPAQIRMDLESTEQETWGTSHCGSSVYSHLFIPINQNTDTVNFLNTILRKGALAVYSLHSLDVKPHHLWLLMNYWTTTIKKVISVNPFSPLKIQTDLACYIIGKPD